MAMPVVHMSRNQFVSLDWSKLLGFDQVRRPDESAVPITKQVLLAKVGNGKTGAKRGIKGF